MSVVRTRIWPAGPAKAVTSTPPTMPPATAPAMPRPLPDPAPLPPAGHAHPPPGPPPRPPHRPDRRARRERDLQVRLRTVLHLQRDLRQCPPFGRHERRRDGAVGDRRQHAGIGKALHVHGETR